MKPHRLLRAMSAGIFAVLLGVLGCAKDLPVATEMDELSTVGDLAFSVVGVGGDAPGCVPLIAGRTNTVGSVCFENADADGDGTTDALRITVTVTDGTLSDVKIWVGTSLASAPLNKAGQPVPGHFPFKSGALTGTSYSLEVPFSAINVTCDAMVPLFIATHATVRTGTTTETAWSEGTRFSTKGNWGMYTTILVDCDEVVEPPPGGSHPAFAYNLNGSNNCMSPGWFSEIPEGDGTYNFILYADPMNCDIDGLIAVGTVKLVYDGSSTATVTFEMYDGFTMSFAAVYHGYDFPPASDPNTYLVKAPLSGVTTHTFTISDFQPFSSFVAQASVDGF